MAASISIFAFQAGPASAATSPLSGSALPIGGDVLAMSCTSAGNCAAVGDLTFAHAPTRPLVVSEKNGTWGRAKTIFGLSALPGGGHVAVLRSVSCSSAGNCSAGGEYQRNGTPLSAPNQGFVVTEKNGVWGKAKAVAGLSALNVGGAATVNMMSCRSAGNCTAAGLYASTPPADGGQLPFVLSQKNGTWGRAKPIRGLAARTAGLAFLNGLSCASPGNCTVAGSYTSAVTVTTEAYVASQKNGVWGAVRTFPAIAALARDGAEIDSVSCRSGGNCTGVGEYYTAIGHLHVFAINETRGTWGAVKLIKGFAALRGGGTSSVNAILLSCPSAGDCTAGGLYGANAGGLRSFVVAETDGRWGRAEALPGAVDATVGLIAGLECFSAGNCTAGGTYLIHQDSTFLTAIFVSTEKNGVWRRSERVPGSVALGTDVHLATLSCGAPRNCSVGGFYGTALSDKPLVATEKNGTWGRAERVPGIQP